MAVTFITPVEVTHSTNDAWTDIDVSGQTGWTSGKTGVIVHVVMKNDFNSLAFGLRKNGSSDDRTSVVTAGVGGVHFWAAIGIDTSGIFEAYLDIATDFDLYLVGWFDSETVFFTNAVDKSTGTTGAWVDVDISGDTGGDTAIGAFVEVITAGQTDFGIRTNGSTDDRATNAVERHVWAAVGVDGSELFEQRIPGTTVDIFLVGYVTSQATFYTNGLDRSLGSTGAYADLTALPAGAIGGIYEVSSNGNDLSYAARENGSAEDVYFPSAREQACVLVECDGSQLVEHKISSTAVDLFEKGYFEPAAAAAAAPLSDLRMAQVIRRRVPRRAYG
jgi:hypothetical protein